MKKIQIRPGSELNKKGTDNYFYFICVNEEPVGKGFHMTDAVIISTWLEKNLNEIRELLNKEENE